MYAGNEFDLFFAFPGEGPFSEIWLNKNIHIIRLFVCPLVLPRYSASCLYCGVELKEQYAASVQTFNNQNNNRQNSTTQKTTWKKQLTH